MYSAPWKIRAVVFVLVPFFSGTAVFPQAVSFIHHSTDPLPLAARPSGRAARGNGSVEWWMKLTACGKTAVPEKNGTNTKTTARIFQGAEYIFFSRPDL